MLDFAELTRSLRRPAWHDYIHHGLHAYVAAQTRRATHRNMLVREYMCGQSLLAWPSGDWCQIVGHGDRLLRMDFMRNANRLPHAPRAGDE